MQKVQNYTPTEYSPQFREALKVSAIFPKDTAKGLKQYFFPDAYEAFKQNQG
jgi:hypothetical protein